MAEATASGTTVPEASHAPAAQSIAGSAPQVFVLAGVAGVIVVIVLVLSLVAHALRARRRERDPEKESERLMKKRLRELDRTARPKLFQEWYKQERKKSPDLSEADVEDQTCVICLEPIEKLEQIRALSCRHIYHRKCFDDWFTGYNDFCPLCHRNVLPEPKSEKKFRRRWRGASPGSDGGTSPGTATPPSNG